MPGAHTFTADIPAASLAGDTVTIDFSLDNALPPGPSDRRELGVIVTASASKATDVCLPQPEREPGLRRPCAPSGGCCRCFSCSGSTATHFPPGSSPTILPGSACSAWFASATIFFMTFRPHGSGHHPPLERARLFYAPGVAFWAGQLPFRVVAFATATADLLLIAWITRRATGSQQTSEPRLAG